MSGSYRYYEACLGTAFENEIAFCLRKTLGGNVKIIQKLTLYCPCFRHDTEIDLVAITPYRIYCIEAKSCKNIVGTMDKNIWEINTRTRDRCSAYNFYYQNIQHIQALKYKYFMAEGKYIDVENILCVRDYTLNETDCNSMFKISDFLLKALEDYNYDEKYSRIHNIKSHMSEIYNVLRS